MYLHTPQQTPQQKTPPKGSQQQTPPRGSHGDEWREMFDPKSGRKYWINRDSKQMSFSPPAAPSEAASSAGGIGLSRLDELLARYEKITMQNRALQSAHTETAGAAEDGMAPTVVKAEGKCAQRSAAPPSPASGLAAPVSPSSPSSGSLEILRFMSQVPCAVDMLEAYVNEAPKKDPRMDIQLYGPQKDPYIQLYGLSMFVDDYAPQTQAKDEMMSFQEADALLARNNKFLEDLLGGDLGSTRQIGEIRTRSALAEQAVKAGVSKATKAATPPVKAGVSKATRAATPPDSAPSPAQQSQEPDYSTYTNLADVFAKKLPPSQQAQRSQELDHISSWVIEASQYANMAAQKSPSSQPQPGPAPPPSTDMVAAPHPAVIEAQKIFGTGETADKMSAEIEGEEELM